MNKSKIRVPALIFGSLLSLVLVFSNFAALNYVGDTAETEQSDLPQDSEKEYVSLPAFSLPAQINVEVNFESHCLFEILFEDDQDEFSFIEDLQIADPLFKKIFSVIISPNAP